MEQMHKINSFVNLGNFIRQFKFENYTRNPLIADHDRAFETCIELIQNSQNHNGWFTPEQVCFAFESWAEALTEVNLNQWVSAYHFQKKEPKTIALILAGNIPLVGFHDVLSVLVSGNKALIKLSSHDQKILPFLLKYMISTDPEWEQFIEFTQEKLVNFDAVIATGSNNSARYFEYYFKDKPHIIRKNRNSVAILTGHETIEDLKLLGEDIFRYYGLGCRSVSKLMVPKDYDFKLFFEAMFVYGDYIHEQKYLNNYDYNKTVYLMSNMQLLDNEFLILKEENSYGSPIATLFYERYTSLNTVENRILTDKEQIQCVVSKGCIANSIPFGKTQKPMLWDYADHIDTLKFLLDLQ